MKLFGAFMLFVGGFLVGNYYHRAETRKAFDAVGIREIVKTRWTVSRMTSGVSGATNTYQVVWEDGKKGNK